MCYILYIYYTHTHAHTVQLVKKWQIRAFKLKSKIVGTSVIRVNSYIFFEGKLS